MTCDEVRDALALVAVGDGEMVDPQAVHHLAFCTSCLSAYRRYVETTGRLLDAVPTGPPPEHLRPAIIESAAGGRQDQNGSRAVDAGAPGDVTDPRHQRRPLVSWAAAALLLVALNIGLLWDGWSAKRELIRLERGAVELRLELDETWSAFAGAPAVYAGSLDFQMAQRFQSAPADAQGFLYARPNGWAVLFRITGLEGAREDAFDVWFDTGNGWERRGALRVDADGVASWLHYSREPEVSLQRVYVAAAGALPGTPEWVSDAVASARVVSYAQPASGGDGDW